MLHPLVQLDEEVGLPALDLAAGVKLLAQDFQILATDRAIGQDVVFDLSVRG